MRGLLLSLLILLQGIPIQQGGKVSGVLRDGMGMPLFGVRVAAVARGDTVERLISCRVSMTSGFRFLATLQTALQLPSRTRI